MCILLIRSPLHNRPTAAAAEAAAASGSGAASLTASDAAAASARDPVVAEDDHIHAEARND